MVKCYPEKTCEFYKFVLPEELKKNDSDDSDLPSRNIGYWNQNILLAQDNKVYYLNIAENMQDYNVKLLELSENSVPLKMNQLSFAEIAKGYYPVQFTFVDKDNTCLVVADKVKN